jgi:hypothetical protein
MAVTVRGQVGPQVVSDGGEQAVRLGKSAEQVVTELHGRYYEQAYRGNLYIAQAIVTAPVIYTASAGTGGPLIWNPPTSGVNVALLAVSIGITVVSTVAAALGITGNVGQTVAPTSTTAIDGNTNAIIGTATPKSRAYRVGTVVNNGTFLLPVADLHTGALTTDTGSTRWVDLGGVVVIPPGGWGGIAASATATTTVAQIGLVYEEVPV